MTPVSEPKTWRAELFDKISDQMNHEIDTYESKIEQKRASRIQDPIFNEIRLRKGVDSMGNMTSTRR